MLRISYISSNWLHAAYDVVNEVSSVCLSHNLSEEGSWLFVVSVRMCVGVSSSSSGKGNWSPLLGGILNRAIQSVWLVVWSASAVSIDSSGTISLIVSHSSSIGAVNGDLIIVSPKSVSVCVRVREESALKHFVVRGLNTWNHVSRRESSLLDLSEIVVRVLVECELSYRDQGIVTMRNHLSDVEDVELIVLSFLLRNELNVPCP